VKADPTFAPHYIVQQFKGYTSRILRKEFPSLKSRLPSLWTRSYYVQTNPALDKETVAAWHEDQKNN
jgi:putative transposase